LFQFGFTIGRRAATNGYEPAKRLRRQSNHNIVIYTLRRASMLNSDLQSFIVSICIVLRSQEQWSF